MQTNKPVVLIVALVILAGSVGWMIHTLRSRRVPYEPAFDECIGNKVGEETVRLLQGRGELVVLCYDPDGVLARAQLRGLRRAIDAHSGMKIAAVESARWGDEREAVSPYVLAGPFLDRVLAEHPQAAALVSLIGLPDPRDGPFSRADPSELPAVVAYLDRRAERWEHWLASAVPVSVVRDGSAADAPLAPPSRDCANYEVDTNRTEP